jgi:hypothetical protein
MDSIYIVTNTPLSASGNVSRLVDALFYYRYNFGTNLYNDVSVRPNLLIKYGRTWEGELKKENDSGYDYDSEDYIDVFLMPDEEIHREDGPFPVKFDSVSYYPVLSLTCDNPMFMLEFVLKLFSLNEDYHIKTVYSKLLSLDDLINCYLEEAENWGYLE